MKKILLFFALTLTSLPLLPAMKSPVTFDIAGIKVAPDDVAKMLISGAEALEKAAQQSRAKRELALNTLQQQLVDLGKRYDQGFLGQGEFDQARTVLMQKIDLIHQQIQAQEKSADAVSNNVQNIVMTGWNTLLENYREEQQRKTHIAVAAASKAVENEGRIAQAKLEIDASLEKLKFVSDPKNLKSYGLFLAGASVGIASGYYAAKIAYRYGEKVIENKPELAFKTSYNGWLDQKRNAFWNMLGYEQPAPTFEDNVIFCPELEEQLSAIARTTQMLHEKGLPHQALLLHGPPGTGKTWYAEILARMSGMDYVITSADRFAQFAEGQDVHELHALLDWSAQTPKGMIIFIDEIDALGAHRNKLDGRWIRLLNAFLARTGKSCTDFKIIGATNRIEALDPAFLSRFPQKICIPLPAQAERERLMNLYLKKYILDQAAAIKINGVLTDVQLKLDPEVSTQAIALAAHTMEGFSGRDIEQLAAEMRQACYFVDDLTLSKTIFDNVLANRLKQQAEIQAANRD